MKLEKKIIVIENVSIIIILIILEIINVPIQMNALEIQVNLFLKKENVLMNAQKTILFNMNIIMNAFLNVPPIIMVL